MIEKGKISASQMGLMMYATIMTTAILLVPSITAKHAQRDLWISPVWASLIGILTVYVAIRLHKLYPGQTIIQYSEEILGRSLGKLLGFFFLFFYFHITGIALREYGGFVVGSFLPTTPMIVTISGIILVSALAVHGGVEVVGRTTQIFVPILVLLLLLLIVLLIPDFKVNHLFPVLRHGFMPSIRGAMVPQSWFSEFFLISFLLPFLTDRVKGMKWGMISVAAVMVTMVVTNMASLLLLGRIISRLTYPVMEAARYISLADFLEHLEALVMAIWVGGTFIKISVFYYALVLGTAEWLRLSDYRPLVLPVGFLLVLSSEWASSNLPELAHFLETSSAFYFTSVQTVIPILLLVTAVIRKMSRKRRTRQINSAPAQEGQGPV